jgi:hypothetical protein
MEFEEMQAIWDSQKGQLTYSLDTEALHRKVKRKGHRVEREIGLNEWAMMAICMLVAGERLLDPILNQKDYVNLFAVAVMAGVTVWMFVMRQRRLKARSQFEPTLLGDLDRAVFEADRHLQLGRTFQWWFLLPAMLIITFELSMKPDGYPLFEKLAVVIPAFILSMVVVRIGVRCKHVPVKRDLESLRDTLTSEG